MENDDGGRETEDGMTSLSTQRPNDPMTQWHSTVAPSYNAGERDPRVSAGPGVLLASYTLGADARRLETLTAADRLALVIRTLATIHPQLREAGMIRHIASWGWDNYRRSGGAFADPGQNVDLIKHAAAAEGRIHFAGEHTSSNPTWIQGALESAVRTMEEIEGHS